MIQLFCLVLSLVIIEHHPSLCPCFFCKKYRFSDVPVGFRAPPSSASSPPPAAAQLALSDQFTQIDEEEDSQEKMEPPPASKIPRRSPEMDVDQEAGHDVVALPAASSVAVIAPKAPPATPDGVDPALWKGLLAMGGILRGEMSQEFHSAYGDNSLRLNALAEDLTEVKEGQADLLRRVTHIEAHDAEVARKFQQYEDQQVARDQIQIENDRKLAEKLSKLESPLAVVNLAEAAHLPPWKQQQHAKSTSDSSDTRASTSQHHRSWQQHPNPYTAPALGRPLVISVGGWDWNTLSENVDLKKIVDLAGHRCKDMVKRVAARGYPHASNGLIHLKAECKKKMTAKVGKCNVCVPNAAKHPNRSHFIFLGRFKQMCRFNKSSRGITTAQTADTPPGDDSSQNLPLHHSCSNSQSINSRDDQKGSKSRVLKASCIQVINKVHCWNALQLVGPKPISKTPSPSLMAVILVMLNSFAKALRANCAFPAGSASVSSPPFAHTRPIRLSFLPSSTPNDSVGKLFLSPRFFCKNSSRSSRKKCDSGVTLSPFGAQ
jgi:hypothetical protein